MDPLIERAADGANRDAPRRKAFIVINFTRMVMQAQARKQQTKNGDRRMRYNTLLLYEGAKR